VETLTPHPNPLPLEGRGDKSVQRAARRSSRFIFPRWDFLAPHRGEDEGEGFECAAFLCDEL